MVLILISAYLALSADFNFIAAFVLAKYFSASFT
jgi:hypothetical protein